MSIRIFDQGTNIPSHGNKKITEFVGNASSRSPNVSVAHMLAPLGWEESAHSTQFDELIIVVAGTLTVTDSTVDYAVAAGQVGWIGPSGKVAFSNREPEPCEYWAVCLPAFSPELVKFS